VPLRVFGWPTLFLACLDGVVAVDVGDGVVAVAVVVVTVDDGGSGGSAWVTCSVWYVVTLNGCAYVPLW
jgi:hypothetical protein